MNKRMRLFCTCAVSYCTRGSVAMEVEEEDFFEVLFELGGSRKPLSLQRKNVTGVLEREIASSVGDACLVPFSRLPCDIPSTSKKVLYLLQRWSVKWQAFVDVKSADEIEDGDRLTAVRVFSGTTSTAAMVSCLLVYFMIRTTISRDPRF